jgi:hypothetical protein
MFENMLVDCGSLIKSLLVFFLLFCSQILLVGQGNYYWIGGSGDWNDGTHWSKNPGGQPAGGIPDANVNAIFNNSSGLGNGSVVTVPQGSFDVRDIKVQTSAEIVLNFDSNSANSVTMNVYGALELTSGMSITYSENSVFRNSWVFQGGNVHTITTGGQDLFNVEFQGATDTYNQADALLASERIRMYGGTWNSNGFDVSTGFLYFRDNNPANNPLTKIFNAGSSEITCYEWDSKLTYGSLTVSGNHTIYVSKFVGSPISSGTQFEFNEIHLLEYPDNPSGGSSVVDHNNFECTDCIIESLVIEDTGRAKLAGKFTVSSKLTVANPGTSVEFSGGNGRSNEVVLNGVVVTPKVLGCGERVIFKNVHNDFTSLMRASGTLTINDAVLVNIEASGGADLILSNGVLEGSSSGWSLINKPSPIDYLWFPANNVQGDWDDPGNWMLLSGGSNGCIPAVTDDVYINNNSVGGIRIPANYTAECRNFIWTNKFGLELELDGLPGQKSTLKVAGDFETQESAVITPMNFHEILFSSVSNNTIITNGVQLPDIKFTGENGEWSLLDDLSCNELDFEAGTLNTQDQAMTMNKWTSLNNNPKYFNFSSSRIVVNGEMALSGQFTSGVTVDPGTSLIECETLNSSILELYDVQLNNSSARTLQNYPYSFNKLILNGTGQVNTQNDLTLNILEFKVDGSSLAVDVNKQLVINSGVISQTAKGNPGVLKSRTSGSRAEVVKDAGNLCVTGYVSFTDIEAVLPGVFNAPFGLDGGNNVGINYDDGATSADLFWVGENGGTWKVQNNWSRVSGGCPANKNPEDAPNLYFNGNSFASSPVDVDITLGTISNNVHFLNSENLTINVLGNTTFQNLIVDGGYVNFVGSKTLDVGTTSIQGGGFMSTDMSNFQTDEMTTNSGVFVVRNGSTARVINP